MVMMRAPQNLVDGCRADSARSSHREVARLKTQHLYGSAGTAILFRTPSRAADSFISMPPYVQNEGMPEGTDWSRHLLRSRTRWSPLSSSRNWKMGHLRSSFRLRRHLWLAVSISCHQSGSI